MSHINIGLKYTECQNAALKLTDKINPDEPCVLYLTGNGCDTGYTADLYASIIYKLLQQYGLTKTNIYGTWYEYDLKQYQVYDEECNTFRSEVLGPQIALYKHKMPLDERSIAKLKAYYYTTYIYPKVSLTDYNQIYEYYNTNIELTTEVMNQISNSVDENYIDELFTKAFVSRIKNTNTGLRLPVIEACKNIRRITLVTHCRGAYVAYQIEQKLKNNMIQLGYSEQEINQILSQLLIINQAPLAPINKRKSTCISFDSVHDSWAVVSDNNFNKYRHLLLKRDEQINPCFLNNNFEHLFLVTQKNDHTNENRNDSPNKYYIKEHSALNTNSKSNQLSQDGQLLNIYFNNILINGVRNSLKQQNSFVPLPTIRELTMPVSDSAQPKISFEEMIQNGKNFNARLCSEMALLLKGHQRSK